MKPSGRITQLWAIGSPPWQSPIAKPISMSLIAVIESGSIVVLKPNCPSAHTFVLPGTRICVSISMPTARWCVCASWCAITVGGGSGGGGPHTRSVARGAGVQMRPGDRIAMKRGRLDAGSAMLAWDVFWDQPYGVPTRSNLGLPPTNVIHACRRVKDLWLQQRYTPIFDNTCRQTF